VDWHRYRHWLVYSITKLMKLVRAMPPHVRVIKGTPHSFGWLRRPELDRYYPGKMAWEAPDGAIYLHPKDEPPLIIEKVIERD
jgi:hypothetical protein